MLLTVGLSLVISYLLGVAVCTIMEAGKVIKVNAVNLLFELVVSIRDLFIGIMLGGKAFNAEILSVLKAIGRQLVRAYKATKLFITRLIYATFIVYDYMKVECKPDLDISENTDHITRKKLSTKDIQNIYSSWCLPTLTAEEKETLVADLGLKENAIRSLLLRKGIIEKRRSLYYVSRRYLLHRANEERTPEEIKFIKDCELAITETAAAQMDMDNVITVVFRNETEDSIMDNDEEIYRSALTKFVGQPFELISVETDMMFRVLITDVNKAECFMDLDPEVIQVTCRDILLNKIINPLKAKHKIPTVAELIYNDLQQIEEIEVQDEPFVYCTSSPRMSGEPSFAFLRRSTRTPEEVNRLFDKYMAEQENEAEQEVAASIQKEDK